MSAEPAVSILTPTYNHERFIGPCIESVLAQTFGSWEQIVIDDGSTDGTADVVRRFTDPRIRYVHQENQGLNRLAQTYNEALRLARAPLIAILEGDDWWPADKLAVQVPAFEDPGVVLAYGITQVVGESNHQSRIPDPSMPFTRSMLFNDPVGSATRALLDTRMLTYAYPVTVMLRRRTLEEIGGFQARVGLPVTDYPTILRISLEGRFAYSDRVLGYWRTHRFGATHRQYEEILRGVVLEIPDFIERYRDRLRLTDTEMDRIALELTHAKGRASLHRGRRLLLEGRSGQARSFFLDAARRAPWRSRMIALLGILHSWGGRPIEYIYGTAGHPVLHREAGRD